MEVRSEMKPTEDARLVARAHETPAHYHVVLAVEARGGEILVVRVHREPWESAEAVDTPLPRVALEVVEATGGGRHSGDGGHGRVG